MRETKQWRVDVTIDEHDDRTRAKARLRTRDETTWSVSARRG